MKCQISVSAPNREHPEPVVRGEAVAKLQFRRASRNGPWAVPKSSESSYTETFSLQKFKKGDTCSPFMSICRANAILCALPREILKTADYTTFSTD